MKAGPFVAAASVCLALLTTQGSASPSAPVHVQGGRFIHAASGRTFSAVGFNYMRLTADAQGHRTFAPDAYNASAVEAYLARAAGNGFNTVRVFLATSVAFPGHIASGTETTGLNADYLDNVADFLRRARRHRQLVILCPGEFPRTPFYDQGIGEPGPNLSGMNRHYLQPAFITSKKRYLADLIDGLLARDRAAFDGVMAVEVQNEAAFHVEPPFSLSSGTLTAPNGLTYNLPADRVRLADESARFWVDEIAASIRAKLPRTLVGVNVFTFDAVSRTGPGDFTVYPEAWRNRFPFRLLALVDSSADYLDVHTYAAGETKLAADLSSIEWNQLRTEAAAAGKPVVVGEFGANKNQLASFTAAHRWMATLLKRFPAQGFQGWLFWTYDTAEQTHLWNATDQNSGLFDLLVANLPRPELPWWDDNFTAPGLAGWTASPTWSSGGGTAAQSSAAGLQQAARSAATYRNYRARFSVRLDSAAGWAGVAVRKTNAADAPWTTGYLVLVRPTGRVELNRGGSTLQFLDTGLDPTARFLDIEVLLDGPRFTVWVNDSPALEFNDPTFTDGFFSLATFNTPATFGPVHVWENMHSTYADWRSFHGLPSAAGPAADFDHDGASDFLEYALGIDPRTAASRPLTVPVLRDGRLGVLAPVNPRARDLDITIETRRDLAAPIPDFSRPVVPQFGGLADLDGVPLSGETRLFHRLQIRHLP